MLSTISAGVLPGSCTAQQSRQHRAPICELPHVPRSACTGPLHRHPLVQPARLSGVIKHRGKPAQPPAAAAASGGGSGSGGIGSGGEGGDGFSGDDGASGWDARRIWTLIYAVSLIGGGVYAYKKKGSKASLYASSAVGFALLAAVWQMGTYPQAGIGIALVTSAALTAAMGNRYRKSRKFMPSGLVALVSLGSTAWYANWPQ